MAKRTQKTAAPASDEINPIMVLTGIMGQLAGSKSEYDAKRDALASEQANSVLSCYSMLSELGGASGLSKDDAEAALTAAIATVNDPDTKKKFEAAPFKSKVAVFLRAGKSRFDMAHGEAPAFYEAVKAKVATIDGANVQSITRVTDLTYMIANRLISDKGYDRAAFVAERVKKVEDKMSAASMKEAAFKSANNAIDKLENFVPAEARGQLKGLLAALASGSNVAWPTAPATTTVAPPVVATPNPAGATLVGLAAFVQNMKK